ncbi:MAG: hypothetical protein HY074_01415 [Deltaproteobacteria bacterium]|nr:hypothetical protein [Deltaproteobacteria bacterium]
MSKIHKTAKGTELPLLNLRGRDYLEVKYRLVWFREEHPNWSIETEFISVTPTAACAKALVRDERGRVIATSHKFENEHGFPDFLEKAETGAIGRALALIGYGTQFCADELDEGDRIVDSPVGAGKASGNVPDEPGDYLVPFGRKFRGKKVRDIPRADVESYLNWLEADALKKGTPLSLEAKLLKQAVERYYESAALPTDKAS